MGQLWEYDRKLMGKWWEWYAKKYKFMGTRWDYDMKMMGKWWEDDRKIMGTWWELDGNYMGKWRKIWEYDGDMGQLWENDGEHMVNIRMVNIWEWSFQQLFSESHSLSCSWTCPTFSTTLSCFFLWWFFMMSLNVGWRTKHFGVQKRPYDLPWFPIILDDDFRWCISNDSV